MDLIYTDSERDDIGVLLDYNFDLAFGADENDFCLTVAVPNNVCIPDGWIYIEGTEYGGCIDNIAVDTAAQKIQYKGRTFHGIINSKVIEPDTGEDYYVVSGEANSIISAVIDRLGLGDLFTAERVSSGINIKKYQFYRYIEGYTGLNKMLASVNAKLKMVYKDGHVILSAVPITVYEDGELDSDHVNFHIQKGYNSVNHIICLGGGELSERMVKHLYVDAAGNISDTQSIFGIDEYSYVYDYPNVESEDELIKAGTDKLKELHGIDTITIKLDAEFEFDIGDVINATDVLTGISITMPVTKKIVTIKKDIYKAEYKVGE